MLTRPIRSLLLLGLLISPLTQGATTGADIYKEVLETTSIYQDEELQAYIETLGNEIVAQSEMAGEEFTFTLLDSPELNAFATRDNYVYVNRGLLNYVRNEAELVSVLAHEVGHITRDHVTGQEGQAAGAQILSAIAAVLSGSNEVYEAGMAYANSIIRGHGRRNELEADEAGAEYMAKLGYSPNEMISMLSMMKDYESLQKKRAASKGAAKQTYHGIFSTHPRNDSRLRTVVSKAEVFKAEVSRDNGAATYRRYTEGLIWEKIFSPKSRNQSAFPICVCGCGLTFPKTGRKTNPTAHCLPARNHRITTPSYLCRLWHALPKAQRNSSITTLMSRNCARVKLLHRQD